ncbi:mitochondrial chaperone BCS1 [Coprinopsis cinerea AmutBmut pab1-1]|nr:mitochondrial chaperone BCS1 [Coprinopsis cinerea AmutBmut pab1-1]
MEARAAVPMFLPDGGPFMTGSWHPSNPSSWSSFLSSWVNRLWGASVLSSFLAGSPMLNTLAILILGTLIEAGRRLSSWFFQRFQLRLAISAQFQQGDPAYDWILQFLTKQKVWRLARDFRVASKSSKRQWGIGAVDRGGQEDEYVEYVPTYNQPQLFRWNGYWVEASRTHMYHPANAGFPPGAVTAGSSITLHVYTWNMKALSDLVKHARLQYLQVSKPHVIIHTSDKPSYGPGMYWTDVKKKARRPLNSIILEGNTLEKILADAREFISMERWYNNAGIPHRRGYLLYGPPGTGKSSTIYALAGELGMEIYSLSLASDFVDDNFLQKASSSVPKNSIFLIEDVDCAFPSREDEDEKDKPRRGRRDEYRSFVTLSGLLNTLDGVGSEEGKLFFATTNHLDRLDPALIRPGRIDMKVEYKLATKGQASALFARFYSFKDDILPDSMHSVDEKKEHLTDGEITRLANVFAKAIPEHEFSTAEIQGYLLGFKKDPEQAAACVGEWVVAEQKRREEELQAEKEKKEEVKASKDSG